jgi:hypothetical protein
MNVSPRLRFAASTAVAIRLGDQDDVDLLAIDLGTETTNWPCGGLGTIAGPFTVNDSPSKST